MEDNRKNTFKNDITNKATLTYSNDPKDSESKDTTPEIKVPIYKDKILYKKETSNKKYKVKLSAPNMYEMFSAFTYESGRLESYWLLNSSQQQYTKAAITEIGVPVTTIGDYTEQGVRVVGNLNKSVIIVKGKGTKDSPYNITK